MTVAVVVVVVVVPGEAGGVTYVTVVTVSSPETARVSASAEDGFEPGSCSVIGRLALPVIMTVMVPVNAVVVTVGEVATAPDVGWERVVLSVAV